MITTTMRSIKRLKWRLAQANRNYRRFSITRKRSILRSFVCFAVLLVGAQSIHADMLTYNWTGYYHSHTDSPFGISFNGDEVISGTFTYDTSVAPLFEIPGHFAKYPMTSFEATVEEFTLAHAGASVIEITDEFEGARWNGDRLEIWNPSNLISINGETPSSGTTSLRFQDFTGTTWSSTDLEPIPEFNFHEGEIPEFTLHFRILDDQGIAFFGVDSLTLISSVPEPTSLGLLGLLVVGVAIRRRRKQALHA